jgi:cytochrome c-type biogenesis protein CcmH/NrfG
MAKAETLLEHAVRIDGSSVDAEFFLGCMRFARREHAGARKAWRSAITMSGPIQPPDGPEESRSRQAARYMLAHTRP